jgi:hypothetical protein
MPLTLEVCEASAGNDALVLTACNSEANGLLRALRALAMTPRAL